MPEGSPVAEELQHWFLRNDPAPWSCAFVKNYWFFKYFNAKNTLIEPSLKRGLE
jgi:hypothetical protein